MMNLPTFISEALPRPIDYSPQFSEKVAALGQLLSNALGISCKHDDEMNYNPGQSLSLSFEGTDPAFGKKNLVYEVRFYLSSKAPLFAVYCFDRKPVVERHTLDHPILSKDIPRVFQSQLDTARTLLTSEGFQEVEEKFLFLPAPGCVTQLDDLPANIFESLFAEIV